MATTPKRPCNMPARPGHGPAKGAGHGGPANGPGQGEGLFGAAKGEGAPPFQPGNTARAAYLADVAAGRRASTAERVERLKDHLEYLAYMAENETTRMNATDRLTDRLEGKPKQFLEVTGDDVSRLSDAELQEELEGRGRATGAPDQGNEAAGMPPKSAGVVH